ncbi:MAG: dTDP-4-dehydrorhamnose 3,5-epimerase [Candidatus Enterosoma sp.]|nr:dTDP-4-dehydrorhamnose 3,5-epimerase [bacterium]MDY5865824.1 dTDP-4-dehydrorhamnose 3,5-epimerase [Candidatus Enterosoma sp.]
MFEFQKTSIEGVYVITPKVYGDKRGYFFESYNKKDFLNAGINIDFVQDNESKSHRGVLRGLHFQKKYPQSKLVRVVKGEVFDVAVDLRKDSKTFGKYESVILSEENQKQFLIPKGFAHGFLVLSDEAKFVYKCDDFYHPEDEGGIIYNDPDININWPFLDNIELSEKDKKHPSFKEIYDYE